MSKRIKWENTEKGRMDGYANINGKKTNVFVILKQGRKHCLGAYWVWSMGEYKITTFPKIIFDFKKKTSAMKVANLILNG